MPLYEYVCAECQSRFDSLRSMADADAPIVCPDCGGWQTERAISLFFAVADGKVVAGADPSCGSCTSSPSACAGCASKR